MTHLSRVLVGVDFSKPARRAFDYALALSRDHGAELTVIQAVPPNQTFAHHGRARVALSEKLRQAAAEAHVDFKHRVQSGEPAEIILLHARSLRPDVIVVGTHQRTRVGRLREGSVAERVAARATAPVLVVPGHRRLSRQAAPFCHLAVAVDFSPASARAIDTAMALTRDRGGRVTLLHVVPALASGLPPYLFGYGLEEHQDASMQDARRRLQHAVPADLASGTVVDTHVLRGDVATELNRAVEAIGADVLVVGVPKRGVFSRALFGATATRVLRVTGVPTFAVPASAAADEHAADRRMAA